MKCSVIIPTYKRSRVIQRAVDSVLAQTFDDFEVIVVDDNGIDSDEGRLTALKMLKYKNNARVNYIQHIVNKNGSAARNTGIKNAIGEYISFLDDDDIYSKTRLEKMVKKMDSLDNSWGACYTGYVKHMTNGKIQKSDETSEGDLFVPALMRALYIGSGSNLFFRRSVIEKIGNFDESFKRNQDLEYLLRVLSVYKMAYVDEVLMEIFYDIRTVKLTYEESCIRENNFRSTFAHYLKEMSYAERKSVIAMYDIDWIRDLLGMKKYSLAFISLIKSKIPIRVWFAYIMYISRRYFTNTCYGFVVDKKYWDQ